MGSRTAAGILLRKCAGATQSQRILSRSSSSSSSASQTYEERKLRKIPRNTTFVQPNRGKQFNLKKEKQKS